MGKGGLLRAVEPDKKQNRKLGNRRPALIDEKEENCVRNESRMGPCGREKAGEKKECGGGVKKKRFETWGGGGCCGV